MLQRIHKTERVPQASSLYCHWICVDRPEGNTQLIAIWIDNEMRIFEGELESAPSLEPQAEGVSEDPGSLRPGPNQSESEFELRLWNP
jgi:hypothetical protein